jgi:hypothetical protein
MEQVIGCNTSTINEENHNIYLQHVFSINFLL